MNNLAIKLISNIFIVFYFCLSQMDTIFNFNYALKRICEGECNPKILSRIIYYQSVILWDMNDNG